MIATAISEHGQDLTRPAHAGDAQETAGGSTAARSSARCRRPRPSSRPRSPSPTTTASSATATRAFPSDAPGVVVHDDWDALGMRASGSHSVSFEGVELPRRRCAAASRPATPRLHGAQPLRRPVARLRSLGIAEAAHGHVDGRAGLANGDASAARMLAAENAIDLSAGRATLARGAAGRRALRRRGRDGRDAGRRCSPRPSPPRRSSTRPLRDRRPRSGAVGRCRLPVASPLARALPRRPRRAVHAPARREPSLRAGGARGARPRSGAALRGVRPPCARKLERAP